MIFAILNTVLSIAIPVYASYATLKQYQRVTADAQSATITIKGVSFPNPLSTVPAEHPLKEEQLQYSLNLQKWFIFWMVRAGVELVENALFLRYVVPFYNVFKLGAMFWLMSGISVSESIWPGKVATIEQSTERWNDFTSKGCGLVFNHLLKPLLEYPLVDVLPYVGSLRAYSESEQSDESVFGSSYILVKSLTSRLRSDGAVATGVDEKPTEEETFDMVDLAEVPEKKGWW